MTEMYAVVLVDSTGHAIRIEKALLNANIANKLIPVPRQLSSDCGVCVRILRKDLKPVRDLLQREGIHFITIEAT